jgi:hypothetical protein
MHDKDKTKNTHLNLSELSRRVYIDHKIWVSTAFNEIQIGIVGGKKYQLEDNELVEIERKVAVYDAKIKRD